MALDEVVDVRQGGGHAAGQGRVAGRHLQRVDPHDLERHAVQAGHLLRQHRRVAAIPSVREHHHDGAPGHPAHAPLVVESPQAITEASATAPVVHAARRLSEGDVRISAGQLAGDPREAGAEGEGLHPLAADDGRMHEAQQGAGVGLHRSGDVEQQHEPARPLAVLEVDPPHRLAAGGQRGPHGAAQIWAAAPLARRHQPAALARRAGEAQLGHEAVGLAQLGVVVLGEVLVTKHLGRAEAQRDGGLVGRRRTVGVVTPVVTLVDRDGDLQRFFLGEGDVVAAAPLPEHREGPVEEGDVLRTVHQRGPSGPVHGVAVSHPDRAQRLGEGDDGVERHREADAAQHARERHGDAAGVAGIAAIRPLIHRARTPGG